METLTTTTNKASFQLTMPKHILAAFLTVPPKGRKATLTITEGIMVSVTPGYIRLQATDLTTSVYWDGYADSEDTFSFVAPIAFLQHFVKVGTPFEYNHVERYISVSGFKMATDSADDFPKLPTHPTGTMYDIDPDQVANMLTFACTDDMRPAMCGINIGSKLCASDGHRLITAPGIETDPFILPNCKFWAKLKTATIQTGKQLTDSGETKVCDYIQVKSERVTFLVRRIGSAYPDFKAVIPATPAHSITVNAEELYKSLTFILPASNKQANQVFIDVLPNQLKVHTYDEHEESEAKSIISNTHTNRPGIQIAFNGKFLASLIKDVKCIIDLKFDTVRKPFVFLHPNGETRLIMPVVICNEYEHEKKAPSPGIDKILSLKYEDYLRYGDASALTSEERSEADKYGTCIGSTYNPLYKYDQAGNRLPAVDKIYTFANPKYTL